MAPRRKAPACKPLGGCVIAFHGNFTPLGYSHLSLEGLAELLGATTAKSVTATTTHLVCTDDGYKAGAVKVTAAEKKGLPIVTYEWLVECSTKVKKEDITKYLLNAPTANGSANGPANGSGSGKANGAGDASSSGRAKRSAPAAVTDDDEEPQSKKTKAAGRSSKVKDEIKPDPEPVEDDKTVAEGQFIKKKGATIPIDEHCPLATYQVYIDPDSGMIYDASLNQTNAAHNNNKFYRIQVLHEPVSKDFKTWTRWGRVGELGQTGIVGDGSLPSAIKGFEKKFRDKSGLAWANRADDPKPGKYAFVERSYDDDDSDAASDDGKGSGAKAEKPADDDDADNYKVPECTLDEPVKELMELIFNQQYFQNTMASLNYDANKLPLGKLSKTTITRGFQQLKNLAALIDDPSLATSQWNMGLAAAVERQSNTYYSLIPHAFGRNRPPVIRDDILLKKEIELLESLSDMKDAAEIMKLDRKALTVHPLDSQYNGLGMQEMTALDPASAEFASLELYLNNSRGMTHHVNYNVQEIFRIERGGEAAKFADLPYGTPPALCGTDRRLLWHGSRCTNFGGILSQGLRIAPPEAPVSGYMFGKGIYLADMSSKSAGYCSAYLSGGHALLLLCEAELGDPMLELTQAKYNAASEALKGGSISTWGQGSTGPQKWMDAGAVHPSLKGISMPDPKVPTAPTSIPGVSLMYNEYICYDAAQVRLRYLFRVKM